MSDVVDRSWILRAPRQSALSRRQRWLVFGAISVVGMAFAIFSAVMFGAWVVLPFTGIELIAVGAAFVWWDVHADDFEAIEISGGEMRVTRQYGRKRRESEVPTAWAQLSREPKPSGWGKRRRLVIACNGQALKFGEFLNEAGVSECQRVLRERLAMGWKA